MSLQVKNLDYQIDGKSILEQICLEVQDGEFVGLVGPNGCGKSTLLKNIYRTYKPGRGTVFLNEKDVLDFSFKKMAGEMAVMAQENHVEFDFEVRDMVMFGRYAKKKFLQGDSAEDKKLCEKCLKEVGLSGYEHRSYLSLSGGEKQRVLLARVLMQESAFIVLDEPTNHLDVSYQYQIMDILKGRVRLLPVIFILVLIPPFRWERIKSSREFIQALSSISIMELFRLIQRIMKLWGSLMMRKLFLMLNLV